MDTSAKSCILFLSSEIKLYYPFSVISQKLFAFLPLMLYYDKVLKC